MKISIISNDKRYYYLNEFLKKDGYESKICRIYDKSDADIVILPVKKEHSELELIELFSRLDKSTIVLSPYGKNTINYAQSEAFLKKNAYLTAEGAICLYYNEKQETLLSKKAVILGYGRIAKYLSKMLKGQGANVYAFARRDEVKSEIILDGINSVELDEIESLNPDVIFNTIPAEIYSYESNVTKIELASKSGFKYNKNVINGGGLPGKMFPKTAAKIIYEEIKPILTSKEKA